MFVYGLPGTEEYVETEIVTKELIDEGYVKMISYPPSLTLDQKLNGKHYVALESGEWELQNDPNFETKMNAFVKKVFNSSTVTPGMYKKLANKFQDIAEKI